jgi:hypothetical protein
MNPPSGRNRKPTPKVANAASVPIAGLTFGKNWVLKTSAATMPYSKKSYQSTTAPIKLPKAALRALLALVPELMRADADTAVVMTCVSWVDPS